MFIYLFYIKLFQQILAEMFLTPSSACWTVQSPAKTLPRSDFAYACNWLLTSCLLALHSLCLFFFALSEFLRECKVVYFFKQVRNVST